MFTLNGKRLNLKSIKSELLLKTPYTEKGIFNVMKSMANEFISSEKKDFLVHIQSNGNVFHIISDVLEDKIEIELKEVYNNVDFYTNSGLFTENITRKNIAGLH